MNQKGNTLHFINRVDQTNCGDRVVSPLLYYFDFFQNYQIQWHDIRFIDFDKIDSSDVVILGGGGLLDYSEAMNRAINKVLDTGAAVIGWAPGFNTHADFGITFRTPIRFSEFAAIGVRDYENPYGLEYLPDVTCKIPDLRTKHRIVRKYGMAVHKDHAISDYPYESITNEASLEDILKFIGETEIVISNSFHMIYWSMLMGKKTICVNSFSTRFHSYQHKPAYLNQPVDDLEQCVQEARIYDDLDAYIRANDAFFERVKTIVESRLTPQTAPCKWIDYAMEGVCQLEKFREKMLMDGDPLSSQLYIDSGTDFSEDHKQIVHNNVIGSEEHWVRFDLSGEQNIQRLRFDPIEGYFCEVEILSAISDTGPVALESQGAVKEGSRDRFYTMDPQYLIRNFRGNTLEIRFCLRLMNQQEIDSTVVGYVRALENTISEQTQQFEELHSSLNRLRKELGAILEESRGKEIKTNEIK